MTKNSHLRRLIENGSKKARAQLRKIPEEQLEKIVNPFKFFIDEQSYVDRYIVKILKMRDNYLDEHTQYIKCGYSSHSNAAKQLGKLISLYSEIADILKKIRFNKSITEAEHHQLLRINKLGQDTRLVNYAKVEHKYKYSFNPSHLPLFHFH